MSTAITPLTGFLGILRRAGGLVLGYLCRGEFDTFQQLLARGREEAQAGDTMDRLHEPRQVLGYAELPEEPRLLRYIVQLAVRQLYRVISFVSPRIVLLQQSQQVAVYVSINDRRVEFRGRRRGRHDQHNVRSLERGVAPESRVLRSRYAIISSRFEPARSELSRPQKFTRWRNKSISNSHCRISISPRKELP